MRFRVLVTAPYFLPEVERFRAELEAAGIELVTADVSERLEEDELLPLVGAVDGVICGDDRFSERVLAAAPRLKVLSKWGPASIRSTRRPAAGAGCACAGPSTPSAARWPRASWATRSSLRGASCGWTAA